MTDASNPQFTLGDIVQLNGNGEIEIPEQYREPCIYLVLNTYKVEDLEYAILAPGWLSAPVLPCPKGFLVADDAVMKSLKQAPCLKIECGDIIIVGTDHIAFPCDANGKPTHVGLNEYQIKQLNNVEPLPNMLVDLSHDEELYQLLKATNTSRRT
ncbi:hypothetical protein [Cohaesibacter celericrescens]|uniref:Uncharacterized protein n=1 Tax=Cohaesibacter celericrescens TaxID=2067669 RepID=A0A2N5XK46_9HYPH|nr:hypothetical protein [Cohaesibacter celericrescens]PLW74810.1 hypothetical protein C0081_21030 [Cohaesibacter celericrescens]